MSQEPIIKFLPPQEEVFWSKLRILFLLWRRQFGKSFTFGAKGLSRCMLIKNHSVFYLSASILMGQENILKEVAVWQILLEHYRRAAEKAGQLLTTNIDGLSIDDIAAIFEASKLETKLWHTRTSYSRTRVIAPNPMTARGFSGDVLGDEFGFWQDFEGVWDAIEPIMSRNPQWIMWLATTPPADDTHTVFDLLNPGSQKFHPNPRGNWFKTETGYDVHRVDAHDGELAGLPLFHPRTGAPVTIEQARKLALNKIAFDRNYLLKFHAGGGAAISRQALLAAQARGEGQGIALDLTDLPAA
jgi:hypothetical protein